MADVARCGLSYGSVGELRALIREGAFFVPYPDELADGQALVIDVTFGPQGEQRAELAAVVLQSDFDESGNVGVRVRLESAALEELERLAAGLDARRSGEVFATTRLQGKKTTGGLGGADEDEPLLEPGTMVDERFRIEAHIATGGMGHVYRANHVHLNRPVALKLLRRTFASDAEMWTRFKREAELVSQLESPHVVRVFDFGKTEGGQPFLAMEYVEGSTVEDLIARGPVPVDAAVKLLRQVCEGLSEAHALGVIHRDLKPANIMLGRRRDGTEVAKILDFGIARLSDRGARKDGQKLTQVGIVVGTPAYLAPEQALADELDERTDIYALGCVAYELLTGAPPFMADEVQKVIGMHLTQAPPDPIARHPELAQHAALVKVVLTALSKERGGRHKSARELSEALASAVAAPVPPAPAPMSADDWPPPSTAAPELPVKKVAGADDWTPPSTAAPLPAASAEEAAAVDDFFSGSPAGEQAPTPQSSGSGILREGGPLAALSGLVPQPVLAQLQARRDAFPQDAGGVAVRVEVMGAPQGSPTWRTCLGRIAEGAFDFGGCVDVLDEDGAVLAFRAEKTRPAGRALAAIVAIGESVALESNGASKVAIRASVVPATFAGDATPMAGDAMQAARALAAKRTAGQIVCESSLFALASDVVEGVTVPEGVLVTARRTRLRRTAAPLIGRDGALEALERRLTSLTQGVMAPVVVRGGKGAGRSVLVAELALRARRKSLVVGIAQGTRALRSEPFGAVTELLCSLCGVPIEQRAEKLRGVLEGLKLAAPVVEEVLLVTGVNQLPIGLTAGQAAHALRSVLRAGAAERPVVVLFDGLEDYDTQSIETFRELVSRPAARELVIGFAAPEVAADRLGSVPTIDLPELTPEQLSQVVASFLDAPPGPRLAAELAARCNGLPGVALDWIWLLDDRGALRAAKGALDVDDDFPELTPEALLDARFRSLPLDVRRLLEAAVLVGETFEGAQIAVAWPRANPTTFQRAVASRAIRPLAGKRWAFANKHLAEAVERNPSPDRPAMHQRLALALVEQGRADPRSVSPALVAARFTGAGDGARAAQLWKHAADVALSRRALRDVVAAARGFVDALAVLPEAAKYAAVRVDALARAADMALVMQDAALARALVDDASALAARNKLKSAELSLALARVMRSEARRARAATALAEAEQLAGETPLRALVAAERGESREVEGDVMGAAVAFEDALARAPAAADLARWHGEVDLLARLEARVAGTYLQRKDLATAQRLLEGSLKRYRSANWPFGESRVLMNLGTARMLAKDPAGAARCFEAAAVSAGACGDLLFQAKALLQQARALKKQPGAEAQAKTIAAAARTLAQALSWEQGRLDAAAL